MSPSPHLGAQIPAELGAYPEEAQVRHLEADEQVLHDPGQATQPWLESKYCPGEQSTCLRTIF